MRYVRHCDNWVHAVNVAERDGQAEACTIDEAVGFVSVPAGINADALYRFLGTHGGRALAAVQRNRAAERTIGACA